MKIVRRKIKGAVHYYHHGLNLIKFLRKVWDR